MSFRNPAFHWKFQFATSGSKTHNLVDGFVDKNPSLSSEVFLFQNGFLRRGRVGSALINALLLHKKGRHHKKARFACSTNRAQVLITPFRGEKFEGTLRTNLKTHREFDNYISFAEWASGSLIRTKLLSNLDLFPMENSRLSSFWSDQFFTFQPLVKCQK